MKQTHRRDYVWTFKQNYDFSWVWFLQFVLRFILCQFSVFFNFQFSKNHLLEFATILCEFWKKIRSELNLWSNFNASGEITGHWCHTSHFGMRNATYHPRTRCLPGGRHTEKPKSTYYICDKYNTIFWRIFGMYMHTWELHAIRINLLGIVYPKKLGVGGETVPSVNDFRFWTYHLSWKGSLL